MIEVIPVACTAVNWNTFLSSARDRLGEPISTRFDRAGMQPGLPTFIVSIGDIAGDEGHPQDSITEAGKRLRHASASFLVMLLKDALQTLLTETDLTITSGDSKISGFKLALVSGNLEQWRNAIIDCCVERMDMDVRLMMNKCHSYFESLGLGPIWNRHSKTRLHDTTYKLLPK